MVHVQRRHFKAVGWAKQCLDTASGIAGSILIFAKTGIYISARIFICASNADRQFAWHERNADGRLTAIAGVTAFDCAELRRATSYNVIEIGIGGDVADCTSHGAFAVQSRLRTLENLDPLEVNRADVEPAGDGIGVHVHFVDIGRNSRQSCLLRYAANLDALRTWAGLHYVQAGYRELQVLEATRTPFVEVLGGDSGDRRRNVEDALFTALRRDDDLGPVLEPFICFLRGSRHCWRHRTADCND